MIAKKLTASKLLCEYKPLEANNEDSLVEVELLLFAINSTISSLTDQSFY